MSSSKVIRFRGHHLQITESDGWEYTERVQSNGVAVILAVTEAQQLVLTEQYRIPVAASVIELPAGLIGDLPEIADESGAEAAIRELEEETGFRAGRVELVFSGPSSAGLTSEMVHFYRAFDLERVSDGGGDPSEDIDVRLVPLEHVHAWLRERMAQGEQVDPKVYAGIHFLEDD